MIRRKLRFHNTSPFELIYDTDIHGPWTLCEWSLSAPVRQTNIITIPGRDGEIDLSPALGDVKYEAREFEASLECSEGDRAHRTKLIEQLTNRLSGKFCAIVLPDDPLHYIKGYIDVEQEYNDPNHCRVRITSRVDPWRESFAPVMYELTASATEQHIVIKNRGGRKVIPMISAYTNDTSVMPNIDVACGTIFEHTFTAFGAIYPEELTMEYEDEYLLAYSGSGTLMIRWQEASL